MSQIPIKVDLDNVDSGCSICVSCGYISGQILHHCPCDHFDNFGSMLAMTPAVHNRIVEDIKRRTFKDRWGTQGLYKFCKELRNKMK